MVTLSKEVLEMFEDNCTKGKLIWLATVDEGRPHVVPVCFVKAVDADKLLIAVNFITKAAQNVKKGSEVAAGVVINYDGYMVRGPAEIITKGPLFEDVKKSVSERMGDKASPKGALVITIKEVFSLRPRLKK